MTYTAETQSEANARAETIIFALSDEGRKGFIANASQEAGPHASVPADSSSLRLD